MHWNVLLKWWRKSCRKAKVSETAMIQKRLNEEHDPPVLYNTYQEGRWYS